MELAFKAHLLQAFKTAYPEVSFDTGISSFLDYLIDHHLITATTIKQYTIIKDFETEYPKHNGHKTQTVYTLANRYDLTDRTIWTILKDHLDKFNKTEKF